MLSSNRSKQSKIQRWRHNGDDEAIEMGAVSTIACFFLLWSMGASLATSYIMVHNPECLVVPGSSSASMGDHAESATMPKELSSIPTSDDDACTDAQLARIKKQLPPENCFGSSWTQQCSFTKATRGCQDPFWMRQVYASLLMKQFHVVLVGFGNQPESFVGELLQTGSHNPTIYDAAKFQALIHRTNNDNCQFKAVTISAEPNTVQILLIPSNNDNRQHREGWITAQTNLGWPADTIQLLPATTPSSAMENNNESVHYMKIGPQGKDYETIMEMNHHNYLDRIWYLEFEYNWSGAWASQSLDQLTRLLEKTHACYWSGTSGNLWRITHCWLDHYQQHSWARITCVNTKVPETKPIHEAMEQLFAATLKKDLRFA